MKKLLSLLLILTMLSSVCAFAQTTVTHTFKADDGYVYHFGTFEANDDDAGLVINGKNYSLKEGTHQCETEGCENAFVHARNNEFKFGMGIKLGETYQGTTYTMAPYATADSTDSTGDEITVDTAAENAALATLTVGGESVDLQWIDNGVYYKYLPYGTTAVPEVSATGNGTVTVTPAATLDDRTEIKVSTEDGYINTYYVEYIVSEKDSSEATINKNLYGKYYGTNGITSTATTTGGYVYTTHQMAYDTVTGTPIDTHTIGYLQLSLPSDIDLSKDIKLSLNSMRVKELGTSRNATEFYYAFYDLTDFMNWDSDISNGNKAKESVDGNRILLSKTKHEGLLTSASDPGIDIDITEMVRYCVRNNKIPTLGCYVSYPDGTEIPATSYAKLQGAIYISSTGNLELSYYKSAE